MDRGASAFSGSVSLGLTRLLSDGMLTADSFGGGDWQAFDLDESIENSRRLSTISDIEVARKADTSGGFRELNESGLLLRTDEKSIAEYSNDDQPDLGVHDAYGDVQQDALELERSVDGPPSLSGQTLDISTDLNASLNNASRMSLDLALVNEEDNTKQIRPKKKRKIGRDSVTELSATFLNQVDQLVGANASAFGWQTYLSQCRYTGNG